MVKKAFRELIRMAETEGVMNAKVDYGTPHDRLVGTVDGHDFEIVISRNCLSGRRSLAMARANIRREVERIRTDAMWELARQKVAEQKAAAAAPAQKEVY